MYNGISKISSYKILPREVTSKVNINKAYKDARFISAASKFAAVVSGFMALKTYNKPNLAAPFNALLCAISIFLPVYKNARATTGYLGDAYREIVARAKRIKKLNKNQENNTSVPVTEAPIDITSMRSG